LTGEQGSSLLWRNEDGEIIREMQRDDIAHVLTIETRSFAAPWTKGLFEETLSSPIYANFVMERENATIGYIILYVVADEAHIMNLAVHPDHRRKGYGARLISHAIGYCAKGLVLECFLEVREGNIGAQKLYREYGFRVIGKRKRYYSETNEDALVMQLSLNAERE
jgi:ribosomal-protein-alanine N-acetyltransferase